MALQRTQPRPNRHASGMMDWHLDMAAELERSGKFDQARMHWMRANLLEPAATSPPR